MSESYIENIEDQARFRIADLIDQVNEEADTLGVQVRVVGSLGVYGLTGVEPKIHRGTSAANKHQCVDIDYLLGLPEGFDLNLVKNTVDRWWNIGMDSDIQIPVSPINLPKKIANNPKEVLAIDWQIDNPQISISSLRGKSHQVPARLYNPRTVSIYGRETETLSPLGMIVTKCMIGWKNPFRAIKDLRQISSILKASEVVDLEHSELDSLQINFWLNLARSLPPHSTQN